MTRRRFTFTKDDARTNVCLCRTREKSKFTDPRDEIRGLNRQAGRQRIGSDMYLKQKRKVDDDQRDEEFNVPLEESYSAATTTWEDDEGPGGERREK